MKFCLSGRQPKSVLAKADEIKMEFRDSEKLIEYIEDFPNTTFIIDIPKGIEKEFINWNLFQAYAAAADIIIGLRDLSLIDECKVHGLKFYYSLPIITWYELDAMIKLEPCYLYVTDSLYFSLDRIKRKTDIPIRLCANLAFDPYIPRENGIYGTWIRPEDVFHYEKWVDALEFYFTSLSHEATLLEIYKEKQEWPGNLNLLITNLNYNVNNRVVPEEFGLYRATCGHKCTEMRACRMCENMMIFADQIRKKYYKDISAKDEN